MISSKNIQLMSDKLLKNILFLLPLSLNLNNGVLFLLKSSVMYSEYFNIKKDCGAVQITLSSRYN